MDHFNAWVILDGALFAVGFTPVYILMGRLVAVVFGHGRVV